MTNRQSKAVTQAIAQVAPLTDRQRERLTLILSAFRAVDEVAELKSA